ncbi:hypothetical protein M3Y97_00862400 [Aphelenchoides bicaudatus]|nr:hypothetical protein M3Y97_00862400 [Aphelenchoides bicaudatus]
MAKKFQDLLIFGKTIADPFHRVNYSNQSVLLLVEFCQAEGPKPISVFPEDAGTNLNLDHVSVWLMSAENFHGSRLLLYNQQMDLHALVYHVTLLDVSARGFQRPIALAFLSPEKPTLKQRLAFKNHAHELFRPFLSCNRHLFSSYAEHVVELANEIQRQKFHTYYSLQSDAGFGLITTKINQIAKQAGFLIKHKTPPLEDADSSDAEKQLFNLQFMDVYRMISGQPSFCECGKDPKEFEKFVKVMERPISTELTPIFELAPCISKSFDGDFREFYNEMTKIEVPTGVLFSGSYPVFKNSTANTHLQENEDDELNEENNVSAVEIGKQFPNENSLSLFNAALTNTLYSLLSGQKIAILASDQRLTTGVDLLNKLNDLKICKRREPIVWKSDTASLDVQSQLIGVSCQREESQKWEPTAKLPVYIDLNNNRLYSQNYTGRLLRQLNSNLSFPSDKALILYLVSIISDVCLIARIARKKPLELIANTLKLNQQDTLILSNVLSEYDLIKYIHKREEIAKDNKRPYKRQKF